MNHYFVYLLTTVLFFIIIVIFFIYLVIVQSKAMKTTSALSLLTGHLEIYNIMNTEHVCHVLLSINVTSCKNGHNKLCLATETFLVMLIK